MARANEQSGFPCFFDLAKDLVGKKDVCWVLEHLTQTQQKMAWARAGELGGFGVEYLPVRIVEQVGLRAKLYSVLFSDVLKGNETGDASPRRLLRLHEHGLRDFRGFLPIGLAPLPDGC